MQSRWRGWGGSKVCRRSAHHATWHAAGTCSLRSSCRLLYTLDRGSGFSSENGSVLVVAPRRLVARAGGQGGRPPSALAWRDSGREGGRLPLAGATTGSPPPSM